MPDLLVRLGILLLVGLLAWLVVFCGRRFVETRRRQALASIAPGHSNSGTGLTLHGQYVDMTGTNARQAPVRILAFSSPDCKQCHTLQTPALQRVSQAREGAVEVIDIDATIDVELARRYRVLTVPTTVILDVADRPQAVNYGFANTQRLLEQVDTALGQAAL